MLISDRINMRNIDIIDYYDTASKLNFKLKPRMMKVIKGFFY